VPLHHDGGRVFTIKDLARVRKRTIERTPSAHRGDTSRVLGSRECAVVAVLSMSRGSSAVLSVCAGVQSGACGSVTLCY